MTEFLETLFGSLFSDNVILATILISMLPIIELRGAIPFGVSEEIWGAAKLIMKAFCGLLLEVVR